MSGVSVDGFQLDCNVREDHSYDNEVTDHPVESGSAVADNIRNRPLRVMIESVVSDSPIGDVADIRVPGALPTEDALALLTKIYEDREPVTVETSLKRFESMALETLSIPRDAQTGAALRFSATFKQIRIVTNNRVTLRVSVPRAKTRVNLGNKQSPTVPSLSAIGANLASGAVTGAAGGAGQGTPPDLSAAGEQTLAATGEGAGNGTRKFRSKPAPPPASAEDRMRQLITSWGG